MGNGVLVCFRLLDSIVECDALYYRNYLISLQGIYRVHKKCYNFRLSLRLRSQANYIQLVEGEKIAEIIWIKSGFCIFVLYEARGIGIRSTESVCSALLLFQPLTIGVKSGKVGIRFHLGIYFM